MSDAPQKPRFEVFLSLVNLCAHLDKHWVVVTQRKLLERIKGTARLVMSRRTLNRHLLGLELAGLLKRQQRHVPLRSGKLRLRATLYTFPLTARLWIKRIRDAGSFPLGRLAVPKMAHSRTTISIRERRAVGKTIHSAPLKSNRAPRSRGGKRRPPAS